MALSEAHSKARKSGRPYASCVRPWEGTKHYDDDLSQTSSPGQAFTPTARALAHGCQRSVSELPPSHVALPLYSPRHAFSA